MTSRIRCSLLALLAIVAACSPDTPFAPMAAGRVAVPSASVTGAGAQGITVMTRNLYIGADVDVVIRALADTDPANDIPALVDAIATLENTAYPLRAEALADEIARARPHVVGLQEVSEIHLNLPPLGISVNQDFLATLQAALDARGLHYILAGESTNLTAAPFPGIDVTDHDAILVDADRVTLVGLPVATTYAFNIGVVAPGVDLERGYVRVAAVIGGMPVTIASTHLESGDAPGLPQLRAAQATELMAVVGGDTPAILLGDFNDTPGSPMYQVIAGAGFTDTWGAMRPGASGFTCCEVADLSNQVPQLVQRIDYVFARGLGGPSGRLLGQITIIGDQPADKIAGPAFKIWPSDHAGLVASFLEVPVAP